jgi:hypothetical protein
MRVRWRAKTSLALHHPRCWFQAMNSVRSLHRRAISSCGQILTLASSPLLDCSGLPCVDVTAGGNTHFKMLVDTGNELSMEDKAKAEALGLELKSLREDYPFQLESRRVTLVQISFRGAAVLPLSATKLHENANLRFVIPSEAEGSAVRLSPKQRPLQVSSQLFGAVVSFLLELSRHAVAN